MENRIKLYLVNGFLGAGKTTMLKELMSLWSDMRIAVIVNEFGDVGMDGVILSRDGISLTEINSGSIFCTCRSDQFITALTEISKLDVSLALVESSGLSDPGGIGKIIDLVQKLTGGRFEYSGNITLVDATGFEDVCHTSIMARRQVVCSDLLVINKIDLAKPEDLAELESALRGLNPYAAIVSTTFARIDRQLLDELDGAYSLGDRSRGGGKVIGIQKLLFSLTGEPGEEDLTRWISAVSPYMYRMKGFVRLDTGRYYIDSTGTTVAMGPTHIVPDEDFVVLLASGSQPVVEKMRQAWVDIFGTGEQEIVFL